MARLEHLWTVLSPSLQGCGATSHVVDLTAGRCQSCGTSCDAVRWAKDVVQARGRESKWLIRSAFHKELRRGDVAAARHWARWMAWCDGTDAPLRYLRRIWSEETWDLDLAAYLHGESPSAALAIEWCCLAHKVWQSQAWWRGWLGVAAAKAGVDLDTRHQLADPAASYLAALGAALREDDEGRACRIRDRWLADLVAEGKMTRAHARVLEKCYRTGRYEAEDVIVVLAAGQALPPTMSAPTRASPVPRDTIRGRRLRMPPDYAYDYHSRAGLQRMRAWLQAGRGREFRFGVDTSPIDLRWAGGPVPLFWRVLAWRRGGLDMDKMAWHDVRPREKDLAEFERVCEFWPEDCL